MVVLAWRCCAEERLLTIDPPWAARLNGKSARRMRACVWTSTGAIRRGSLERTTHSQQRQFESASSTSMRRCCAFS